MPDPRRPVVQHRAAPSEAQFHAAVVAALGRVAHEHGRGALADKSGRTTRSLDKVFAGSTPCGKGLCDFLLADDTALDEVLALYGVKLCPRTANPDGDMQIVADLARVLARFTAALEDGKRIHTETLDVAAALRPLMPKLTAIIDEADALRAPT